MSETVIILAMTNSRSLPVSFKGEIKNKKIINMAYFKFKEDTTGILGS